MAVEQRRDAYAVRAHQADQAVQGGREQARAGAGAIGERFLCRRDPRRTGAERESPDDAARRARVESQPEQSRNRGAVGHGHRGGERAFVETGLANRDRIGMDTICFETDYPHTDTTWPNSKEYVEKMLADFDDDIAYKVLRGNAIRMLELDRV